MLNLEGREQKLISETMVEKTLLMHSQNKNVHGKMFGGYIMSKALDSGWICAKIHCKYKEFKNICIDSVTFHKPVNVYQVIVNVSIKVYNDIDGVTTLTTINVMHLSQELGPIIIPNTYDDGLKYLEAIRRSNQIYSHY